MARFGERVAAARKRSGLTQRQIGEALGVATTVISDMERGTRPAPCPCRLLALAVVLGVSPESVLRAAALDCDHAPAPGAGNAAKGGA